MTRCSHLVVRGKPCANYGSFYYCVLPPNPSRQRWHWPLKTLHTKSERPRRSSLKGSFDRELSPQDEFTVQQYQESSYYLGKLAEAVHILTVHPDYARARLRACWTPFVVAGVGVPPHLKGDYLEIHDALTKRHPVERIWLDDVGKVEADEPYARMVYTTRTMRKKTASALAERILTLKLQWKHWVDFAFEQEKRD